MRRSHAPSMRKVAKMSKTSGNDDAATVTERSYSYNPPSPPMQWGTGDAPGAKFRAWGPQQYEMDENPLQGKRIFAVLWRNPSTKKHKTWQGDGTFEVTAAHAILKDDCGKIMGELSKCFVKEEQLKEGTQLQVGSKEIELQEELTTAEECIAQRKREIFNWHEQGEEPWTEQKKQPKGAAVLLYDLSRPQKPHMLRKRSSLNSSNSSSHEIVIGDQHKVWTQTEYICMLLPDEQQEQALRICAEYSQSPGVEMTLEEIMDIAQLICDHPLLLKQHVEQPSELMQLLLQKLPPWQDFDIYNSTKFEFVHLMLDELVAVRGEKCAIAADSLASLSLIRGYCRHRGMPNSFIDDVEKAERFNADNEDPLVALVETSMLSSLRFTSCKYLVLYNCGKREAASKLLTPQSNTKIYTLITAGWMEEHLLQQQLQLISHDDSTAALMNINATHSLIGAGGNALDGWNQWPTPHSEEFLQTACLNTELQSLSYIYTKQTKV